MAERPSSPSSRPTTLAEDDTSPASCARARRGEASHTHALCADYEGGMQDARETRRSMAHAQGRRGASKARARGTWSCRPGGVGLYASRLRHRRLALHCAPPPRAPGTAASSVKAAASAGDDEKKLARWELRLIYGDTAAGKAERFGPDSAHAGRSVREAPVGSGRPVEMRDSGVMRRRAQEHRRPTLAARTAIPASVASQSGRVILPSSAGKAGSPSSSVACREDSFRRWDGAHDRARPIFSCAPRALNRIVVKSLWILAERASEPDFYLYPVSIG
ncbi:hypothetical protein FB451DRAFT_1405387 [Mycena latifolia]|nr:hypothetical protein FB451DRAFT_1405387 [Mycena latifolia]